MTCVVSSECEIVIKKEVRYENFSMLGIHHDVVGLKVFSPLKNC